MTRVSRVRTGLVLGLILGAGYSITSNLINKWMLPGINLFAPPPGTLGLILITTAMFGLLGAIAAWPDESLPGVILTGVVGSLLSSLWIALTATGNQAGTFFVLFIVILPRVFFYAPFGALIRWLLGSLEYRPYKPVAPARRLIPVLLSFIAFTLLGLVSLYPQETRLSIGRMEALMQDGMQAASRAELPKPLQNVEGFVQNAVGAYTYDIGRDPEVLPVQRPVVEYGASEPFLIIRFENGFRFGCVFSPPYVVPACVDF